jgi:hypothetical protein
MNEKIKTDCVNISPRLLIGRLFGEDFKKTYEDTSFSLFFKKRTMLLMPFFQSDYGFGNDSKNRRIMVPCVIENEEFSVKKSSLDRAEAEFIRLRSEALAENKAVTEAANILTALIRSTVLIDRNHLIRSLFDQRASELLKGWHILDVVENSDIVLERLDAIRKIFVKSRRKELARSFAREMNARGFFKYRRKPKCSKQ